MTEQQPTVASLRVDKPGKSKFAPVINTERRRAATGTQTPAQPDDTQLRALDDFLHTEESSTDISNTLAHDAASASTITQASKRPTTVEAVAARRERRKSLSGQQIPPLPLSSLAMNSFFDANANDTSNPQSAASLALYITPSERNRVTMASFLKDTGLGVPMSLGNGASGNHGKGSKKINTRTSDKPNITNNSSGTPKKLPKQSMSTTVVPQVRIVNGEIVVDEAVAAITPAEPVRPAIDMEVINETGRHLTSHAFVRTIGNNRWNREETAKFYEALSMCGTDFAMISLLFPKRSREQVKGKYKLEERGNPAKVALYLKNKKSLDTEWLERAQYEKRKLEGDENFVEAKEEKKPGRPKRENDDNLDNLFSSSSAASSPAKSILSAASPKKFVNSIASPSFRQNLQSRLGESLSPSTTARKPSHTAISTSASPSSSPRKSLRLASSSSSSPPSHSKY